MTSVRFPIWLLATERARRNLFIELVLFKFRLVCVRKSDFPTALKVSINHFCPHLKTYQLLLPYSALL